MIVLGSSERISITLPGYGNIATRYSSDNESSLMQTLFNNASNYLSGPVDYKHTYVDMSQVTVTLDDGSQVSIHST